MRFGIKNSTLFYVMMSAQMLVSSPEGEINCSPRQVASFASKCYEKYPSKRIDLFVVSALSRLLMKKVKLENIVDELNVKFELPNDDVFWFLGELYSLYDQNTSFASSRSSSTSEFAEEEAQLKKRRHSDNIINASPEESSVGYLSDEDSGVQRKVAPVYAKKMPCNLDFHLDNKSYEQSRLNTQISEAEKIIGQIPVKDGCLRSSLVAYLLSCGKDPTCKVVDSANYTEEDTSSMLVLCGIDLRKIRKYPKAEFVVLDGSSIDSSLSYEQATILISDKFPHIRYLLFRNQSDEDRNNFISRIRIDNASVVDAANCSIKHIDGDFTSHTKLLILSGNALNNIVPSVFLVESVNLSYNSLGLLPRTKYASVKRLDCSNNCLASLDNFNFVTIEFANFASNVLSYNEINKWADSVGPSLSKLHFLDLSYQESVNDDIADLDLSKLAGLSTLRLRGLKIGSLKLPKNLKKLDVKDSSVKSIHGGSDVLHIDFDIASLGADALEYAKAAYGNLEKQNNKLISRASCACAAMERRTGIRGGVIANYDEVMIRGLKCNVLRDELSWKACANHIATSDSVVGVSAENNVVHGQELSTLFQAIFHRRFENIAFQYMKLVNAKLKFIPVEVFSLRKMKYLFLSKNEISGVPGHISGLDCLVEADLSYNKITFVDNNMFGDNMQLKLVNLSHNNITTLMKFIDHKMCFVEKLNLSHNMIEDIDYILLNCCCVKELYVNNNKIQHVDFSKAISSQLEVVDLSYNEGISITNANKLCSIKLFSFKQNSLDTVISVLDGVSDMCKVSDGYVFLCLGECYSHDTVFQALCETLINKSEFSSGTPYVHIDKKLYEVKDRKANLILASDSFQCKCQENLCDAGVFFSS
ncbi:MAG: leucine-rich repeat domain-containing protein [Alphaproteobacteria bacterium]|nr:MAG: leucine-rich repeat domain-containing protein [Alphaproteobacteria bacterium]